MRPRRAARLADLFTAAVIASVGLALAGLTWRLAIGYRAPATVPVVVAPRSDVDVTPIIANSPFGASSDGAPMPTTLPLELRGIVAASDPAASTALIAPTGGAPSSYRLGDTIAGAGPLQAIGIDNVVFLNGGRREMLAFPKAGAPPAPDAATAAAPILPPAPTVAAPAALAASPQAVLDGLGAIATPGGYRLGDTLAPSYRQAGLHPGDVIEQVNGTKLGNPLTDQQVLAAAARAGTIRVDVVRGDQRVTLSFPVR